MSEWISVEDRLPVSVPHGDTFGDKTVLVTDGVVVCEATFQWGGHHILREWAEFCDSMISRKNVTHWMPLPEPPK